MTQPTLINLHPNEYTQRLSYYPFAVNLDRCMGSSNTLNDYLIEYLTEDFFDMIMGISESKCTKNIYHANVNVSLMEANVAQIKSGIMRNVYVSAKIQNMRKRFYLESCYM